jgi:hypothetical protein
MISILIDLGIGVMAAVGLFVLFVVVVAVFFTDYSK